MTKRQRRDERIKNYVISIRMIRDFRESKYKTILPYFKFLYKNGLVSKQLYEYLASYKDL